jgi:hypothetical protein
LLFRLSAVFLLRFAERNLLGWLFQEPPRNTRALAWPAPRGKDTPMSGVKRRAVGLRAMKASRNGATTQREEEQLRGSRPGYRGVA